MSTISAPCPFKLPSVQDVDRTACRSLGDNTQHTTSALGHSLFLESLYEFRVICSKSLKQSHFFCVKHLRIRGVKLSRCGAPSAKRFF